MPRGARRRGRATPRPRRASRRGSPRGRGAETGRFPRRGRAEDRRDRPRRHGWRHRAARRGGRLRHGRPRGDRRARGGRRRRIGHFLTRKVEKGQLEQADRDDAVARCATTTELDALAGCDLVIEAIVEELEPKRVLFAELDRICRPDAILATNTSALSVTEIAAATTPPGACRRHALLQSGAPDAARRDRPGGAHLRRDRRGRAAVGTRLGKEVVRCHDTPGSSSTAS